MPDRAVLEGRVSAFRRGKCKREPSRFGFTLMVVARGGGGTVDTMVSKAIVLRDVWLRIPPAAFHALSGGDLPAATHLSAPHRDGRATSGRAATASRGSTRSSAR